jgi:hypothetical protein
MVNTLGCNAGIHYIRTEVGSEVECRRAENSPHRALSRFALQFPEAEAVQLVRDARQLEQRGAVAVVPAGEGVARLSVWSPQYGNHEQSWQSRVNSPKLFSGFMLVLGNRFLWRSKLSRPGKNQVWP